MLSSLPREILDCIVREPSLREQDLFNLASTNNSFYSLVMPILFSAIEVRIDISDPYEPVNRMRGYIYTNIHLVGFVQQVALYNQWEYPVPSSSDLLHAIEALDYHSITPNTLDIDLYPASPDGRLCFVHALDKTFHIFNFATRLVKLNLACVDLHLVPILVSAALTLEEISMEHIYCPCLYSFIGQGNYPNQLKTLNIGRGVCGRLVSGILQTYADTLEELRLHRDSELPPNCRLPSLRRLKRLYLNNCDYHEVVTPIIDACGSELETLFLTVIYDEALWITALRILTQKTAATIQHFHLWTGDLSNDQHSIIFLDFIAQMSTLRTLDLGYWKLISPNMTNYFPLTVNHLAIAIHTGADLVHMLNFITRLDQMCKLDVRVLYDEDHQKIWDLLCQTGHILPNTRISVYLVKTDHRFEWAGGQVTHEAYNDGKWVILARSNFQGSKH